MIFLAFATTNGPQKFQRQLAKAHENLLRFGRMAVARSGEIDEPVEKSRPINWLIRRVCG